MDVKVHQRETTLDFQMPTKLKFFLILLIFLGFLHLSLPGVFVHNLMQILYSFLLLTLLNVVARKQYT
jgi:hypothetical protein